MPELSIELMDDGILDAGDGIHIPRSWVAVVTGLPDIPGTVRAHLVYDPTLRRAAAESIRDLRVQAIVKWAAARVVRIDGDLSEPETYGQYLTRLQADESRSEEQILREAVRLYRLASVINDGPLKLVSEQLGVSVSTATRMMNRARIAGLVDEATGREVLFQTREQQRREQSTGRVAQPGSSGPSIGR